MIMFQAILASGLFLNVTLAVAQDESTPLGLTSPANAQERTQANAQEPTQPEGKHLLQWKLREGDTFYVVQDTKMQQSMSFMGQDIDMNIKTQSVLRYRVKKVQKNATVVEMTFLRQKMEMDGPVPVPGADFGEKLKNLTFTFTVDDKWNVVKFEGYDKFLEAIAGEDPMLATMLRTVLPESVVKQSFGQTFSLAPDKPLAVGDTWQRKEKMSLGPLGSFEVNTRYKLDEVRGSLARLSIAGDMKWSGGDDGMAPKLPFKISEANIRTDKFDGFVTFDLTKGRLESSQMKMNLKGTLTLAIADQKVEMDIKQQMHMEMKVVDRNPVTD
jgi:hypothetical protein